MTGSGLKRRHYLIFDFGNVKWRVERQKEEVSRLLPENTRIERGHKPASSWMLKLSNDNDLEPQGRKELHSLLLVEDDLRQMTHACDDPDQALAQVGIDLRIRGTDYWDPGTSTRPLFGNRSAAHHLMGLPRPQAEREKFSEVNVVIVDQGIDRRVVDACGGEFSGGWKSKTSPVPGNTRGGHGSMLVRNVLSVAPGATIFDLPVIPAAISGVPTGSGVAAFLCDAHAAFEELLASIEQLRVDGDRRWKRPWVILNAWAVFNNGNEHRKGSFEEAFNYTTNPMHPLNEIVGRVAAEHDVVFAAGNCGQFCPSRRCGVYNVGPGHSILGANSHPDVLTVGAVRTDGLWLGYSSQGPGALERAGVATADEKPDICAPSQFGEDDDESTSNTGTSAASALAAGFVARYRAIHGTKLTTRQLKLRVRDMAVKVGESDPARCGHGIIHWE
jgi:hypothetical protein